MGGGLWLNGGHLCTSPGPGHRLDFAFYDAESAAAAILSGRSYIAWLSSLTGEEVTVQDSAGDVAAARAANIPIILIDHTNPYGGTPVCSILENNVSVGRIAAEELIHTECKRIAFAAHSFDYEAIQDRQLGVEKAVAQAEMA